MKTFFYRTTLVAASVVNSLLYLILLDVYVLIRFLSGGIGVIILEVVD